MRRRTLLAWLAAIALPLLLLAQQVQTMRYSLEHRDVRSVLARVTEELGPKGQIWVNGAANQITVEDEAPRVEAIRSLLRELDVPARLLALGTRLEVLPAPAQHGLFRGTPGFVDMTAWAQNAAPLETYTGVMDLFEGQSGSCPLGKTYRLEAKAQGYDPSRRRLALADLDLYKLQEGRPPLAVLQGAAVLPEGDMTVFLVNPSPATPPLRLKVTPTLLPSVTNPEVR